MSSPTKATPKAQRIQDLQDSLIPYQADATVESSRKHSLNPVPEAEFKICLQVEPESQAEEQPVTSMMALGHPSCQSQAIAEVPEDNKAIDLKSRNGFSVNTIAKRSLVKNNASTPRAS